MSPRREALRVLNACVEEFKSIHSQVPSAYSGAM